MNSRETLYHNRKRKTKDWIKLVCGLKISYTHKRPSQTHFEKRITNILKQYSFEYDELWAISVNWPCTYIKIEYP